MRTTVHLDSELVGEAEARAAQMGCTPKTPCAAPRRPRAVAEARPQRPIPRLPTFAGDGLQPGVDIDSNAALLDIMEDRLRWRRPLA